MGCVVGGAVARARVDDVVVVVRWIMGSRAYLDGREVWARSGGALVEGIRTLGGSVSGLQLPQDVGDGHPGDGVVSTGLMNGLHLIPGVWGPVGGYDGLLGWLERELTLDRADPRDPGRVPNLVAFHYDWRLSNRYTAARLKCVAER